MKKLFVFICIFASAFLFAGCTAFDDLLIIETPEQGEYTMVTVHFSNEAIHPSNFPAVRNQLLSIIGQTRNGVTIVNARLDDPTDEGDRVLPLRLTLENVPYRETIIDTEMFYRTRTTTIFNPTSILPQINGVSYYFALQSTRRSTAATTEYTRVGGYFVYVWSADMEIILIDTFANRPMYFFVAIFVAAAVGVAVYFSCKKKTRQI